MIRLNRADWALSPRPEVNAATMEARLALDVSGPQCDVVDPLIHALMRDGARWVRVEAYDPAAALASGKVLP